MMRRYAVLAGMLMVTPAVAQEAVPDCDNAVTQVDITACAWMEWEAEDKALNAAYAKAREAMRAIDADLAEADRGAEKSLRTAQKAWITFRDSACTAEGYGYFGGSIRGTVEYGCKAELTRQRTQGLKRLTEGY